MIYRKIFSILQKFKIQFLFKKIRINLNLENKVQDFLLLQLSSQQLYKFNSFRTNHHHMNPHQPNGYQTYQNSYKPPQYNPNQYNNQQQFNQNTLNIPQSHNFNQGGSLSPSQNNHLTRPKLDRAMYSSTIQSFTPNRNFGLGKLQSMGRFIGTNDEAKNDNNKFQFNNNFQPNQQNQFSYQQNHEQKIKSFEKSTPSNQLNQFDRFPAFNLQDKTHGQTINANNFQYNNINNQQQKQHVTNQTPEQKRKRQILAIKQQLQMINKKMQNANLSKKLNHEAQKNDSKFNINQAANLGGNNNNYLNVNNNNFNINVSSSNNTSFSSNNQQQSSFSNNNGLQFNKSNQLNTGYQRNRGLATQSMIVSNQPSSNYKFTSIFDKYDSLKKPTYQTTQTAKQQKPLLLDKFVNKGPGLQQQSFGNNFNSKQAQNSQKTSFDYKNLGIPSNNVSNSNITTNYYDSNLNKNSYSNNLSSNIPQKTNDYSNLSSNYSKSTTSSYTSSYSNNQPNNFANQVPKQAVGTGGGMFKKKKQPSYLQQVKHQYNLIPTSPKNFTEQTNTFKKAKTPVYEQNLVTNAMKKMNIQQSVQFKRQDFVVGKKLGKGQFGQVMLVQHKKTGFLCGMKVMQKKQIRQEKYEGQITRQLSIQFYLAHRNITPLYGYFQDQKNVYLLIQYCTGGQLLEMLRKNRRMQQPEVSRVIRQIIQGIDYIHKQLIIHRDIKPENILFNFGVAKICDFGWAVYKGHGMRKTASVGSPLYYSPEIVMGVQYDEKIDIWDIGMMTYQCLLGKIPFRIYSQLDLNRIVQDEIKFPQYIDTTQQAKDFILKIMKKKPQERMQIRQMLRHPFITKYQDPKLAIQIMKDFKQVLSN